jgi:thiol-disulfide isomerase/thioredoxin
MEDGGDYCELPLSEKEAAARPRSKKARGDNDAMFRKYIGGILAVVILLCIGVNGYAMRSRDTGAVVLVADSHTTYDDLADHVQMHSENGVNAVDLTPYNWDKFLEENPHAFVDMYAPWCVWSQRFAPTWEEFATEVKKQKMSLGVGKVDCVAQADLCRQQEVMAYPGLHWYHEGQRIRPDFQMNRTVESLIDFARQHLEIEVLKEDQTFQPESKEPSAKKLVRIHGAGRD